ncbi:MAG TPA: hypothetical protein VG186_07910 [Solirubrobacteraceae bacterium]|jgi:hypothetical protein|nr:hypothetical protein [Solirubrobacteraceae bacterium]
MTVSWVHPSWRDLVIDHLSSDDDARTHFLRHCAVHGALLALSSAGGPGGRRERPLLKCDADWDALTDRLYDLAPEFEQAEEIGVLEALRSPRGRRDTPDRAEAEALSRAVLARLAGVWKASRAPIALPLLEAWLAAGERLSPPPPVPDLGVTWAELLPAAAPDLSDRASLERFADWLTLADLVGAYDPAVLDGLGFPGTADRYCEDFLHALERDLARVPARSVDQVTRALGAMSSVLPRLAYRAYALGGVLERVEYADIRVRPDPPPTTPWEPLRGTGHLDVARVLADL